MSQAARATARGFTLAFDTQAQGMGAMRGIYKFDLENGKCEMHDMGGRAPAEPVYVPALGADPHSDERYFGVDPKGSKGGGYADMRGAKPLVRQPS